MGGSVKHGCGTHSSCGATLALKAMDQRDDCRHALLAALARRHSVSGPAGAARTWCTATKEGWRCGSRGRRDVGRVRCKSCSPLSLYLESSRPYLSENLHRLYERSRKFYYLIISMDGGAANIYFGRMYGSASAGSGSADVWGAPQGQSSQHSAVCARRHPPPAVCRQSSVVPARPQASPHSRVLIVCARPFMPCHGHEALRGTISVWRCEVKFGPDNSV